MGFIQSNHSRILYNNTMISFNMVEAARQNKVRSHHDLLYPIFASPATARFPAHHFPDTAHCPHSLQVKRFLYTSSACIYPEHKQLDTDLQV